MPPARAPRGVRAQAREADVRAAGTGGPRTQRTTARGGHVRGQRRQPWGRTDGSRNRASGAAAEEQAYCCRPAAVSGRRAAPGPRAARPGMALPPDADRSGARAGSPGVAEAGWRPPGDQPAGCRTHPTRAARTRSPAASASSGLQPKTRAPALRSEGGESRDSPGAAPARPGPAGRLRALAGRPHGRAWPACPDGRSRAAAPGRGGRPCGGRRSAPAEAARDGAGARSRTSRAQPTAPRRRGAWAHPGRGARGQGRSRSRGGRPWRCECRRRPEGRGAASRARPLRPRPGGSPGPGTGCAGGASGPCGHGHVGWPVRPCRAIRGQSPMERATCCSARPQRIRLPGQGTLRAALPPPRPGQWIGGRAPGPRADRWRLGRRCFRLAQPPLAGKPRRAVAAGRALPVVPGAGPPARAGGGAARDPRVPRKPGPCRRPGCPPEEGPPGGGDRCCRRAQVCPPGEGPKD